MKNDDEQYDAHAQKFRDAGLTAESLAAARKAADEAPPQLVRSHRFNPNDPAHCDSCFRYADKRLAFVQGWVHATADSQRGMRTADDVGAIFDRLSR